MGIKVVNKYKHTPANNDIYIGRGSVLGNPFTSLDIDKTKAEYQCASREESIVMYEAYLFNKINEKDKLVCRELNKIYILAKHGDVNLVCYCKPKQCHGDIIKAIIEEKLQ